MGLAKGHDHKGAIDQYTAAIELEDVPGDVKAMAIFNRGLAHMAAGDFGKSVEDLEEVLVMDKAPENVKTMARHKLVKRKSRQGKNNV
jgi:predicted TPR repeat methyltransferase